jgi:hypothetical protein
VRPSGGDIVSGLSLWLGGLAGTQVCSGTSLLVVLAGAKRVGQSRRDINIKAAVAER